MKRKGAGVGGESTLENQDVSETSAELAYTTQAIESEMKLLKD